MYGYITFFFIRLTLLIFIFTVPEKLPRSLIAIVPVCFCSSLITEFGTPEVADQMSDATSGSSVADAVEERCVQVNGPDV